MQQGPEIRARRSSAVIVQLEQQQWQAYAAEQTNQELSQDRPSSHRQGGNFNYPTTEFELLKGQVAEIKLDVGVKEDSPYTTKQQNMVKKQPEMPRQPLKIQIKAPINQLQSPQSPPKADNSPESPRKIIAANPGHHRLKEEIKKNKFAVVQLNGQVFVYLTKCCLYSENRMDEGRIMLTNYRLAFFIKEKPKLQIPLGFIQRVAAKTDKKSQNILEVILKYTPVWKFSFENQQVTIVFDSMLNPFIFPPSINEYFAFSFAKGKDIKPESAYSFEREYERIGLLNNKKFRRVDNSNGKFCQTYPSSIIVPYQANEQFLKTISKCRDRQRFAVATYLMKGQSGISGCLWRSSQINASSDKWLTDIEYLSYLSYETKLVVIDARTKQNSRNMEAIELYRDIEIEFAGIESVQEAKTSYNKMIQACIVPNNPKFIRNLVDSKWYEQVRMILKTAERVSQLLQNSRNVLVKCADGWDRTSQICALAMILLDPYYRTLEGFEVLVEKEFCGFGEPFHLRLGNKGRSEEQIPIFIQFLDCVSQIMYQFPLSFEFSYKYLSLLANLIYTNKYGNFLASCQKEATEVGIKQKSLSIWPQLAEAPLSLNPFYSNPSETGIWIMTIVWSIKANRFWRQHFYHLTTPLKDNYRIHPDAQENEDYINLRHLKLNFESELLKKNLNEQTKTLKRLKEELQLLEKHQRDYQDNLIIHIDS